MSTKLLMLNEAAARCGVSKRTLQRYIADGTGPATVVLSARCVAIIESDLTDWIQSRRRAAPGSVAA